MSEKITITRRSIIGFGYNAICSQHWNASQTHSWLAPDPTEHPTHTGTPRQVLDAIHSDRTLASFRSGGTCYTTAFFVKLGGKWRRMTDANENTYALGELTTEREKDDPQRDIYGHKYHADAVTVEIE